MKFLHDLGQFIQRDFSRRSRPRTESVVNLLLFLSVLFLSAVQIVALPIIAVFHGWGWLLLYIPGIFVVVFLIRFARFYAKKYRLTEFF